ncbi:amidohydrolase family protein [Sinomicrobium sp. M5D2P17]
MARTKIILLLSITCILICCQSGKEMIKTFDKKDSTQIISFETSEMTDPHIDISPDGSTILFDVLGDLYTVPIHGGKAELLIGGKSWDVRGRYSPDGKRIAFLSDRDGMINLWTIDADGTNPIKYDVGRHDWDFIVPAWTPNEGLINLYKDDLVAMESPERQISFARKINSKMYSSIYYNGSFSVDDRYAYIGGAGLNRIDMSTGETMELPTNMEFGSIKLPRVAPDGKGIAYIVQKYVQGKGEYCTLHIKDIETGKSKELADSLSCDMTPDYAFTPDGNNIILARLGKMVHVNVVTGETHIIPVKVPIRKEITPPLHHKQRKIPDSGEVRTKIIRWPTFNSQNNQLVYSAFGKLYTTNTRNKDTRRLTTDTIFEYAPAISPDGKWIAYTTWGDVAMGHIMIVSAKGGIPRQLTKVAGRYTNPVWSSDGTKLAFISDETEARMGLQSQHSGPNYTGWKLSLNWIPVFEGGKLYEMINHNFVMEITPIDVRPERFYAIPTFSQNGKRIFISTYKASQDDQEFGPVLLSVNLDGSGIKYHVQLPHADEVVISPDNHHVAIVKEDQLWVADISTRFDKDSISPIDLTSDNLVTKEAPVYVSWQDKETLIWANTNKIYQQNIIEKETKYLTDIDIRKPRNIPKGSYALVNARIITMNSNEIIECGIIIIRDNRISKVGEVKDIVIPKDIDSIINLDGKTIIPGLIDVHAHFHLANYELWPKQNRNYVGNLTYGVTTIYDPSTPTLDVFGQAEMTTIGEILAPRIYSSGTPIEAQIGSTTFRDIKSQEDAHRVIQHSAKYGATPLKEYIQPHRKQRQWLRNAAQKSGVLLTSHYTGSGIIYNGLTRVADGFTAIEHELRKGSIYGDVIQFIATSRINYTPTLMVSPGIGGRYSNQINVNDSKLNRFTPPFLIEKEKSRFMMPGQKQMKDYYNNELIRASKTLANIVKYDGLISVGGHGNGFPGLGTHWEMWAFTLGGMPIHEALRAATLNGAKKMDLDTELGSIEPGKLADIVVLNSNPIEDIYNSKDVLYVIKNGFIYDSSTMTQIWPMRKRKINPWPWEEAN